MTKSETIDAIMQFCPAASPAFLAEFSVDELTAYLRRLRDRDVCTVVPSADPTVRPTGVLQAHDRPEVAGLP